MDGPPPRPAPRARYGFVDERLWRAVEYVALAHNSTAPVGPPPDPPRLPREEQEPERPRWRRFSSTSVRGRRRMDQKSGFAAASSWNPMGPYLRQPVRARRVAGSLTGDAVAGLGTGLAQRSAKTLP